MSSAQVTFTTRGMPRAARGPVLRTLADQGLLPVEPLAGHLPEVELVKWRLGAASVLWGSFAGVRQVGTSRSGDDLFFGINTGGTSLAGQQGRRITLNPGDAVLASLDAGAFTVVRPTASGLIGVRLPRRAVETGGDPRLRLVPGRTAALHLLTAYLRSLIEGGERPAPELADAVVRHAAELITLSLRPPEPDLWAARHRSVRAARLAAIRADVDRSFTDPSLTAATVAARHGITTRYLHKLFETEAATFSRYVLDRRLARAAATLRDPRHAGRTISAVANDSGFGDLSYFNRTFRRRYGVTPSEARRLS